MDGHLDIGPCPASLDGRLRLGPYLDGLHVVFPPRRFRRARPELRDLGLRSVDAGRTSLGRVMHVESLAKTQRITDVVDVLLRHRATVTRVELAVDWLGPPATRVLSTIGPALVLRNARNVVTPPGCATTYWNAPRGVCVAFYGDRPSKVMPGGPPVGHLELRFERETLRDLGLDDPRALVALTGDSIVTTVAHFTRIEADPARNPAAYFCEVTGEARRSCPGPRADRQLRLGQALIKQSIEEHHRGARSAFEARAQAVIISRARTRTGRSR
jgi:hypothetical protein